MKCEHKYVNMEDGTRDKFCVRCSKKAMQAVAYINPEINIEVNIEPSNMKDFTDKITEEIVKGLNRNLMHY